MYFLILLASVISFQLKADVITCVFTEPFVTTVYSTPKSTLTYKTMDKGTIVIEKVSIQIKSGQFDLVSRDGRLLQELILNHKGSDGMSDTVYPYEGKDYNALTRKGVGGCSSNFLKIKK